MPAEQALTCQFLPNAFSTPTKCRILDCIVSNRFFPGTRKSTQKESPTQLEAALQRRTFIKTLPLAAASGAVNVQAIAADPAQNAQSPSDTAELPKFQPPGAEKFIRPDVHSGDRPSGASFATRSPALGLNGAAGTAHPLATQTAIEMLKRGGSAVDAAVAANAVLGFRRAHQLRPWRRLLRLRLGPEGRQTRGHGQLRPLAKIAYA